MISEGEHVAVARQWDWGLTKGGPGKPPQEQVCVQFEIIEGPDAGQCIQWFGFFSEKTVQRTIESLRYCGWKGDDIMNMEGMGDLQVKIVVAHEEQTEGKNAGKVFPKVRWVNRMGGGGPIKLERPMEMSQKRLFAAKLKLHAKRVPAVAGGYPAPAGRADTQRPGEGDASNDPDDIPF